MVFQLNFSYKKNISKQENKILFLGRISPIKNLEILILAMPIIKDKKIMLEIVGPSEDNYLEKLKILIKENKLEKRVKFTKPIYDISEKISKLDSAKIFVLPSKSEAMPQALIEAMSRENIVIANENKGTNEIIKDNINGYLFEKNNSKDLAKKIDSALSKDQKIIKRQAKKSVEKFSWNFLIKELYSLL